MPVQVFTYHTTAPHRIYKITALTCCLLPLLTLVLDFIQAKVYAHGFYITESLLFSSCYWLLYIPLIRIQLLISRQLKVFTIRHAIISWILLVAIHIVAYPAGVWLLSAIFYTHTFSYTGTLLYACTQYTLLLLLSYGGVVAMRLFAQNKKATATTEPQCTEALEKELISYIMVTENRRQFKIFVNTISHITANPPYINIHCQQKRYLHQQTLKAIAACMDNKKFVRVHKSAIVNISTVISYQSRLNGDYDLTLNNGTHLRLSRNYAAHFKAMYAAAPQHTLQ